MKITKIAKIAKIFKITNQDLGGLGLALMVGV